MSAQRLIVHDKHLMRLELGQFNLFDSSAHIIHTSISLTRLIFTKEDRHGHEVVYKKLMSYFLQNELWKVFWNPTNLSVTNIHYFCYHINHEISLCPIFMYSKDIALHFVLCTSLTHSFDHLLSTQWKHFLSKSHK